mmetsp:Transcript_10436/g.7791  ORF Transcript_10436/g.7791 Transcript_10436/m.7791 type:complete len:151 (-) Transcript_10436:434-886(-)|eukprot:CAMPEP_0202962468 /NCGR_PEP_ID=MMETSP1396-20130829/6585_1 /ASSEMBLY_ACC=CAM_ASM_000872 /TAXON_ID= /ORGANISM="Pseudokeronopsis sp., Strain Brazil" /LENGTH=150 /DNA_ID=CAMNT_0049683083 /DNA_START=172 /DNA_END=624 /DNA_ORIENTATION=-
MNRQRYVEDYHLLNEEYDPREVWIQSTHKPRAIQSAYAETIGLYPTISSYGKLKEGELESLKEGKGLPPFKMSYLGEDLGEEAVGVELVPVFTYLENTLEDDIRQQGCKYAEVSNLMGWANSESFESVEEEYLEVLKKPVSKAFDLSFIV